MIPCCASGGLASGRMLKLPVRMEIWRMNDVLVTSKELDQCVNLLIRQWKDDENSSSSEKTS